MTMAIGATALLLALLCAAIMGLAIQRGGTCTVAAMEELLATRRPARLLALVEAALWVGGGLLVARELGFVAELPAGFALTHWTLAGAVLLGLGAIVNRACVIGSIARLGSGDLAFAAMPVGFYLGCSTVDWLFMPPVPQALEAVSPIVAAPAWLIGSIALLAVVRIALSLRPRARSVGATWSPHVATALIGLAFLCLLLLIGAWSYTDLIADLARAMGDPASAKSLLARVLIGIALLAGALLGGRLTRQLRFQPFTAKALARCFGGGVLMGWGSLLTPGGNDALVLIGMPLLWPYAWAAFASMCLTVAVARWSGSQLAAWRLVRRS
jgi:toxin CptA